MDTEDKDMQHLQNAVAVLMEHFDTVQVFCSRYDGTETTAVCWGSGNWYARRGQIQDWLVKENESTRINTRPDNTDI